MENHNQTVPPKNKKSAWQIFNEIFPRFSYKVIFLLMILGIFSMLFRWIKWHI